MDVMFFYDSEFPEMQKKSWSISSRTSLAVVGYIRQQQTAAEIIE